MDFDQTCTETPLWYEEEMLRFWWPWPHFQSHTSTLNVKFWPKNLSAPYLFNQMIDYGQTLSIVSLGLEVIRFWWPWPNFQGHHTIKTVKMSLVCTLSPEPIGGFWPNLYRNTNKTWGKMIRFWWPWPHFQGHISTLNVKFWQKKLVCTLGISWTKWCILAKLYVLYHWDN